jgi:hypothetical protein
MFQEILFDALSNVLKALFDLNFISNKAFKTLLKASKRIS